LQRNNVSLQYAAKNISFHHKAVVTLLSASAGVEYFTDHDFKSEYKDVDV